MLPRPPISTLFPYTTLFRSASSSLPTRVTSAVWRSRSAAASRRRKYQRRRSEEHTSELQSRQYLVCRLLLEKKKNDNATQPERSERLDGTVAPGVTL